MKNNKGQALILAIVVGLLVLGTAGFFIIQHERNTQVLYNNEPTFNDDLINNAITPNEVPIEIPIEVPVINTEPIVVECIQNWSCSSWSSCKSYKTTRTCIDLNNCLNETKKPSLTKSCGSGGGSYTPTPPVPEPIVISDVFSLLNVTHKNLTDWLSYGEQITINYTLSGKTFQVLNVPENYTAVYYKDSIGYVYTGEVVFTNEVITNLPMSDDENAINDSNLDYCNNGFNSGVNCTGAKLWLVPTDSLTGNVIDWNRASEFYFETDLINYTKT